MLLFCIAGRMPRYLPINVGKEVGNLSASRPRRLGTAHGQVTDLLAQHAGRRQVTKKCVVEIFTCTHPWCIRRMWNSRIKKCALHRLYPFSPAAAAQLT